MHEPKIEFPDANQKPPRTDALIWTFFPVFCSQVRVLISLVQEWTTKGGTRRGLQIQQEAKRGAQPHGPR